MMEFARPTAVALIEDDADFRHALVERLILEGYDVRAFSGAEPALRAIDADFPGVVITDLRMPGLDGRQPLAADTAIQETNLRNNRG